MATPVSRVNMSEGEACSGIQSPEQVVSITDKLRRLSSYVGSYFAREAEPERLVGAWEVVEEIEEVYAIEKKLADNLAGLSPLAARAAKFAYELPEGVREVEIDDRSYSVSFLRRMSGVDVVSRPAIFFECENRIIVAIPGTENLNDWLSNLKSETTSLKDCISKIAKDVELLKKWIEEPVLIHTGFLEVALSIFSELKSKLEGSDRKEVIFTGHSQGAAVAQVLAFLLASTKTVENPFVITFASPRVFAKESYNAVAQTTPLSLTISHPADIVPKAPLGAQGFRHVGVKVSLSLTKLQQVLLHQGCQDLTASTTGDLDAATKVATVASALFSPFSLFRGLAEFHGIEYYAKMCNEESAEYISQIISGKQVELSAPHEVDRSEAKASGYSVKFIRGKDEDEDGVTFLANQTEPVSYVRSQNEESDTVTIPQ